MREIKFRGISVDRKLFIYGDLIQTEIDFKKHFSILDWSQKSPNTKVVPDTIGQYTGLKDKNGMAIYEGDILEFADKWEWYKTTYGIKMRFADPDRRKKLQEEYEKSHMERRLIQMPECYEWLLSSEIQTYWHIIGNIHENPELLNP